MVSSATSSGSPLKNTTKNAKKYFKKFLTKVRKRSPSPTPSRTTSRTPPSPSTPTQFSKVNNPFFSTKAPPSTWKVISDTPRTSRKARLWAIVPQFTVAAPDIPGVSKPDWAMNGVNDKARRFHTHGKVVIDNDDDDFSVNEQSTLAQPLYLISPCIASGRSEFSANSERGVAKCDVTQLEYPCQAAHAIEKRYSMEARLATYFALRGWISPNSRINYLYLRNDVHFRLDQMTMLLYIKHRLVIDKIRNDYLSFVRQLKPDDPAVDWLSLLRTHHPDLCDGTSFEYAICVRKDISSKWCPHNSLVSLTLNSYVHPLTILVRLCMLLNETGAKVQYTLGTTENWTTSQLSKRDILEKFKYNKDDENLILENMQLAADIYALMPKPFKWFKKGDGGGKTDDTLPNQESRGEPLQGDDSVGGDSGQEDGPGGGHDGQGDDNVWVQDPNLNRGCSQIPSSINDEDSLFRSSSSEGSNSIDDQGINELLFETFKERDVAPKVNKWISGLEPGLPSSGTTIREHLQSLGKEREREVGISTLTKRKTRSFLLSLRVLLSQSRTGGDPNLEG
ncbi:uncharacterized protein C8R40DRAFT_1073476 [Lentinula edodes]|uniref:uncharacterized protein n=1 Tax=Lentinula edodes TaxID=5353 RepID=UPI001E8CD5D3|nr:uncharacterized protein C8R40DRAFT_1073476 [Lentinula edodes]KAH7870221.1 hypothetical protein C8R40DRAFT_1073476 [Lentinula edodes]